ncbi:MAG: rhomboid family intramembrane serine protease [Verrucomicrobiota bacterium]|nr:rhomboid family intramembrane serine protease [Verrucomicrobiota bacterium]
MRSSSLLPPLPRSIKILLAATLSCTLFSHFIFPWLALANPLSGHFYPFQLLTYPLVQLFPSEFLSLIFRLYMLWVFGAGLASRMRQTLFFTLYAGATLIGGLLAFLAMKLFQQPLFFWGSSPPLYAIVTVWTLLNKETHLLLFFTLPIKAAHLLLIFVGFSLAVDLSAGHFAALFAGVGATLFGYLFTLLVYKTKSSFQFLMPFENRLLSILEKWPYKKEKPRKTQVYDIKSGKAILSDEEFMDAMLTRISRYGETSLSSEEKARLEKISKNRKTR